MYNKFQHNLFLFRIYSIVRKIYLGWAVFNNISSMSNLIILAVFRNSLPVLEIYNIRDVNYRFFTAGEFRNVACLPHNRGMFEFDRSEFDRFVIRILVSRTFFLNALQLLIP